MNNNKQQSTTTNNATLNICNNTNNGCNGDRSWFAGSACTT